MLRTVVSTSKAVVAGRKEYHELAHLSLRCLLLFVQQRPFTALPLGFVVCYLVSSCIAKEPFTLSFVLLMPNSTFWDSDSRVQSEPMESLLPLPIASVLYSFPLPLCSQGGRLASGNLLLWQ